MMKKPLFTLPLLLYTLTLTAQITGQDSVCLYYDETELWGTARFQGAHDSGVIFKTDANGDNLEIVHEFDESNGALPYSGLTQAADGLLYGVTSNGGTYGVGVLYSIDPVSYDFNVLHEFDGTYGRYPYCNLIVTSSGLLMGASWAGGVHDNGTLFTFDITSHQIALLHDFDNLVSGLYPYEPPIEYSPGMFYGITFGGGPTRGGVIYQYSEDTEALTVLHNFGDGGENPKNKVIITEDGKMYGAVNDGVTGFLKGGIFEFDLETQALEIKVQFEDYDLSYIEGNLILADDGKIYGLSTFSGDNNHGAIYSYDPDTDAFSVPYSFEESLSGPECRLLQACNGKFYGTTTYGGSSSAGTLFEYNYTTNTASSKHSFSNGYPSINSKLTEIGSSCRKSFSTVVLTADCDYTFNDNYITESGSYEATLMSSAGCDSIVSLDLTIIDGGDCLVLATAKKAQVEAYPNPVLGDYVSLSGLPAGEYAYVLMDALGREVGKGSIRNTSSLVLPSQTGLFILSVPALDVELKLIKKNK